MKRADGRKADELRPIHSERDYVRCAEGSVLFSAGNTRVLCNVTLEDGVPAWFPYDRAGGWVTAEYALLPRSTHRRSRRETAGLGGRTHEINRLIGRALRAAINLELLGSRTCTIDCDVIQADGGTRTAAVTGGYIALRRALDNLITEGVLPPQVLRSQVAAVSVGLLEGCPLLDLCYAEDVRAEVDANIVMASDGRLIEVQGTAEAEPFSRDQLNRILDLAEKGITQLFAHQLEVLG